MRSYKTISLLINSSLLEMIFKNPSKVITPAKVMKNL